MIINAQQPFINSLQKLRDEALTIDRVIPLINAIYVEFEIALDDAQLECDDGNMTDAKLYRARARAYLKSMQIAQDHLFKR